MSQKTRIYRKDYTPSNYLIKTTDLTFEFCENFVLVSSVLSFCQNLRYKDKTSLFLKGEDLILLEIELDGETPNYKTETDGLMLYDLPKSFLLKTKVKIYPNKNTNLNGLYQSGSMFCTQCEAHGFRRITYYLDRPDVLSRWSVEIIADKNKYPIQLSNGNFNNGKWLDPHPKPCYLFALVVGDLVCSSSEHNGVALEIYTEKHNVHKTDFALASLRNAMIWDEARFGFKYDLDTYMIVAVDDFNMGAMENKGLNIFNSTYVLADSHTTTDEGFIDVEAVIGHEYFHNWTGNRITCQDWFQLSLKEGLTVFRDQEFTSDLHARSIKRIEDVNRLRTFQFLEDAGPMAHPVRPESYIEMNNFYTATVYEKGAEVIRMIHTLLGEAGFQKGIKLYVERYDGRAITIDGFIQAMCDANTFDFAKFMPWYSSAGTPNVTINNSHNIITIVQEDERLTPIKYGVLDEQGVEIENGVLIIDEQQKSFDFSHLPNGCVFSWLRDFSAPIKLTTDLNFEQKILLVTQDTDAFNRWDNTQQLWLSLMLKPEKNHEILLFNALETALRNIQDKSLLAQMLTLPSEKLMHQQVKEIDVFAIHNQREWLVKKIAQRFKPILLDIYQTLNSSQPYELSVDAVGKRALKNVCLYYLLKEDAFDLIYKQFKNANCMTDRLASFELLIDVSNPYKNKVLQAFYHQFKSDVQVMDKYFSAQSHSSMANVESVKTLMQHELFSFNTPNRLRSVVGSFSQNYVNFHNQAGYEFFTDIIIKLNTTNPQIGARLVATYNHWKRFTPELKALQKQQLERIANTENLSKDIFEIVQAALK